MMLCITGVTRLYHVLSSMTNQIYNQIKFPSYYSYVVHMLIALKDPSDDQKREKVEKIQQGHKYKKDNLVIPQVWLHPKEGKHINSIDSILHHSDLIGEKSMTSRTGRRREEIEGYLSQKGITRWTGTVTDVHKMWIGTITFKRHFEVRFIPQSVQTGKPKSGDTVTFCLGFDRLGLSAWWVRHENVCGGPLEAVKPYANSNEEESFSDKEESISDTTTSSPSPSNLSSPQSQRNINWDDHVGRRLQGIVVLVNSQRGFGCLKHPNVQGDLFFHAHQLAEPVIVLEGNIEKFMALEFKVEALLEKIRAADIHVVEV